MTAARPRHRHRGPALLATVLLVLLLGPPVLPARAAPGCAILRVHAGSVHGPSTLSRVELPAGTATRIRRFGYEVNAIGYSPAQGRGYGIATQERHGYRPGSWHRRGQVVSFDLEGTVREHGPLRHSGRRPPWVSIRQATAGAISGTRWYVKWGSSLQVVDIDPDSPSFLHVLRSTALRPASVAGAVHDFDLDPADGALYGVSTRPKGRAAVVRIDPGSGAVRRLPGPHLPRASAYGAATLGPDDALYVTADVARQRSRLYRVPRDGSAATELSAGSPVVSSDATGCLPVVRPPAPPTPAPPPPVPPSPVPPSPAPPAPTSTTPAAPEPVVPPATTPEPEGTTPPPARPVPPRSPARPPVSEPAPTGWSPPRAQQAAEQRADATERKRRWSLAVLVVIIAGSAAARHVGRR
ncbi:DUF6923 family protein [Amycolatopsis aidingensis]|uniref:DUF6923 family protein n=1 Tax=Amycolatopsis aidingensis TaxID=2842453 RepID=UPI001C0DF832|nr:hypothetical protein [Amycolatopsis aidingensis]